MYFKFWFLQVVDFVIIKPADGVGYIPDPTSVLELFDLFFFPPNVCDLHDC